MTWHLYLYLWLMMGTAQPVAPNDPVQFHDWAVNRFQQMKTLEYRKIQPVQGIELGTLDSSSRRPSRRARTGRSSVRRFYQTRTVDGISLEQIRLWKRMERPANEPYRNFVEDQWP
jgi:hypothetical protein